MVPGNRGGVPDSRTGRGPCFFPPPGNRFGEASAFGVTIADMSAGKPMTSLRSDAQRNRRRLLASAAEVLREQGLDASLDEISRRAGVGNATLYRHFPSRETLYEAVYLEQVDARRQSF